jgi:hypothetical protein
MPSDYAYSNLIPAFLEPEGIRIGDGRRRRGTWTKDTAREPAPGACSGVEVAARQAAFLIWGQLSGSLDESLGGTHLAPREGFDHHAQVEGQARAQVIHLAWAVGKEGKGLWRPGCGTREMVRSSGPRLPLGKHAALVVHPDGVPWAAGVGYEQPAQGGRSFAVAIPQAIEGHSLGPYVGVPGDQF